MIGVASPIKDNTTDALLFRALSNKLAHLASGRYFSIMCNRGERLDRRLRCTFLRGRKQSLNLCERLASLTRRTTLLRLSTFAWSFLCWLLGPGSLALRRGCFGKIGRASCRERVEV